MIEHGEGRRGPCSSRRRALLPFQPRYGGRKLDGRGGDEPGKHRNEKRHERRDRVRVIRVRNRGVVDVERPLPWFASGFEHYQGKDGDGDDGDRLEPGEVSGDEAPVDRGEEGGRFGVVFGSFR